MKRVSMNTAVIAGIAGLAGFASTADAPRAEYVIRDRPPMPTIYHEPSIGYARGPRWNKCQGATPDKVAARRKANKAARKARAKNRSHR